MIAAVQRLLLTVFGRLPRRVRRRIVRTVTPSFTVGAMCVVERDDGMIVLIQQRYRAGWGLPGGLLSRGEDAHAAAVREVREEIGIEVELDGEPTVVVEPRARRVDVVFRARRVEHQITVAPTSPEIVSVDWFAPDSLPDLQVETADALAALKRAARNGE